MEKQKIIMTLKDEKTILLFDIDSTLTPARQPINKEMTDILSRLNVAFAVVAGSHMELLKEQFFAPLFEHGFRGVFDAFINNGPMLYRCDYREKMSIELVSSFNLRESLGEKDYQEMLNTFKEVLAKKEFQLPPEITVSPEKITDRISMVNFIPMGRLKVEGPEEQENRKRFVEFAEKTGYRAKILTFLNERLKRLREKKGLKILMGGQTSFDIVIDGYDKTYPLRQLVPAKFEKAIFIGDALFPGKNDYVVQEYVDNWDKKTVCPIETVKTSGWEETIQILKDRNFLN